MEAKVFDVSSEFHRYQGEIQVSATRVFDRKALGRSTLNKKGERTLGATDALRSLSDVLARDTADWIGQTLAPTVSGLHALDIRT